MLEMLCPKVWASSVVELDIPQLKQAGIRGVIFDLDNTLVEWKRDSLRPEVISLVGQLKEKGFQLCILSNALEHRVRGVAGVLNVPYLCRAVKPRKSAFRKALRLLGTKPHETAVVGDQLFTDILGGNRLELYTILTPPLSSTEFIYTKVVRILERFVLNRFRKQGIIV